MSLQYWQDKQLKDCSRRQRNGNRENNDASDVRCNTSSISSGLYIPLWDCIPMTTYKYEMEKSYNLGINYRWSIGSQIHGRLASAIHRMCNMLISHNNRVYANRNTLLRLAK